jgi:hypothetical protein
MSTKANHIKQYYENKKLLSEPIFQPSATEYGDWIVTIAFYCAVHLIEKALAQSPGRLHSPHHFGRFENIRKVRTLNKVAADYQTLYIQSIRSRYKCHNFGADDIMGVLDCLTAIEAEIA